VAWQNSSLPNHQSTAAAGGRESAARGGGGTLRAAPGVEATSYRFSHLMHLPAALHLSRAARWLHYRATTATLPAHTARARNALLGHGRSDSGGLNARRAASRAPSPRLFAACACRLCAPCTLFVRSAAAPLL